MRRNLLLCAVLVVCVVASSRAVSAQDNPDRQSFLSIKIGEQSPEDAQPRIPYQSDILITGQTFSYLSGGLVKPKTGKGELETGLRVTGTLQRTDNGMVQLAMKIRIATEVPQEDLPKTDLVTAQTLEIRTVLRPGKTKRLKCSAFQWCEIRVDDVKWAAAPSPPSGVHRE